MFTLLKSNQIDNARLWIMPHQISMYFIVLGVFLHLELPSLLSVQNFPENHTPTMHLQCNRSIAGDFYDINMANNLCKNTCDPFIYELVSIHLQYLLV